MLDRQTAHLAEIEDAIEKIRAYTSGLDRAAFAADSLRADATAMNLVVIGEAAHRLNEGVRAQAPEIAWRKIVGLRHLIVHTYGSIDHERIWDTLAEHLDPLAAAVRRLLAARGE